MLAQNGRLKIAIQQNGRITDESTGLLRGAGLDFEIRSRALFSPCRNFDLDVLAVRDDDIPEYVQDGVSDLGIVGRNVVAEKRADVVVLESLGFGKCRLVVCAPGSGPIKKVAHLRGKRIATSYPGTVRRFLAGEGIRAEVIEISGSVEITPALDVADATCDIVSTGSTARVNGLEIVHTVMESEALLIANPAVMKSGPKRKRDDIGKLLVRIRSLLSARGRKYVMMNAPSSAVERIRTLIPGMKSPTIMPLADPKLVAVHSVVGEDVFWDVIEKLKAAGASDIVVLPIEKFVA